MPAPDPAPPRPDTLTRQEIVELALGAESRRGALRWIYLDPRGRIARRTFWLHGVLAILVLDLLGSALLKIAAFDPDTAEVVAGLPLIWPLLAIAAKRFQDFDWSPWWALLHFLPGLAPVLMTLTPRFLPDVAQEGLQLLLACVWGLGTCALIVVLGTVPGTPGANRFGRDPHHLRRPALNSAH